jgi:dTDP-4-dehydrorhamnose 3,5-epimerase
VSFPDGVRLLAGERPIEGVKVLPLRRIPDERGTIFHMMKATDPWFERFGEIYFSTVYEGVIKGWHLHRDMTLNYACMHGRVKCAIYDDRDGSPSRGSLMEVHLGPDSYSLLVVPPGVWNGFKGVSPPLAIVANCCTHAHDPARSSRLDPFDNPIPYDWALKHH